MPCSKSENYGRTPNQIGQIGTYPCPCCGYFTLHGPPGSYEICSICYWEDDEEQFFDPTSNSGANRVSLVDAQKNFMKYGFCENRVEPYVRPVEATDKRAPKWRLFDPEVDKVKSLQDYYWDAEPNA